ncbi:MAG: hypothetical protein EHM12_11165 [Dehalococcoidia bacterium]|nr:MAG: hypothetical protein EHM12_11165 [Dehalococcoidia bacterium]
MNINNNEQYDVLDNQGKLYSQKKDGLPKGFWKNILAKLYPIILVILSILNAFFIKKLFKRISWNPVIITTLLCWTIGITWNSVMMAYDKNFQAWMFHPWSTIPFLDKFYISHILDWIFYPICGIFFILILELNANITCIKFRDIDYFCKTIIIFVYFVLIIAGFFVDTATRFEILFFALPGLSCVIFLWHKGLWNLKQFLFCSLIFISMACLWDLLATTWLHNKYAWCQQYFYISFDKLGNHYQSYLFRDWNYKWAWIGQSPIAITPFFSIYGTLFIYGIYYAIKYKIKQHTTK